MSTRARIGIENEDGSVTSIYTHWDGYPRHHGPILTEHYADEEAVRALIALGDLSVLAPELGEKHDFDAPPDDTCNAYGRDRGEREVRPVTHPAEQWPDYGQEHEYLFRGGTWQHRERYTEAETFEPLTPEVVAADA